MVIKCCIRFKEKKNKGVVKQVCLNVNPFFLRITKLLKRDLIFLGIFDTIAMVGNPFQRKCYNC